MVTSGLYFKSCSAKQLSGFSYPGLGKSQEKDLSVTLETCVSTIIETEYKILRGILQVPPNFESLISTQAQLKLFRMTLSAFWTLKNKIKHRAKNPFHQNSVSTQWICEKVRFGIYSLARNHAFSVSKLKICLSRMPKSCKENGNWLHILARRKHSIYKELQRITVFIARFCVPCQLGQHDSRGRVVSIGSLLSKDSLRFWFIIDGNDAWSHSEVSNPCELNLGQLPKVWRIVSLPES